MTAVMPTTTAIGSDVLVLVKITGVSPLLVHKFTDSAAAAATKGVRSNAVGEPGLPRDIAADFLYTNKKGRAIIPGPNLYRAIIDAGKFHKHGKKGVTTMKNSIVPASMWIEDHEIEIDPQEWEVDSRPVTIPATQGKILRHRPRFDEWSLQFTIRVNTEQFSLQFARKLIDDAGSKIGLGDFRPDRKGPYGRFVVVLWEEIKT